MTLEEEVQQTKAFASIKRLEILGKVTVTDETHFLRQCFENSELFYESLNDFMDRQRRENCIPYPIFLRNRNICIITFKPLETMITPQGFQKKKEYF